MFSNVAKQLLIKDHWIITGITLGVYYWFLESSIDTLIIQEGDFIGRIFSPETKEITLRVFVLSIIMVGSYLLHLGAIEQKITSEAMETAKDYAKNLIDSSLDMIIAVNLNNKIIEFNPAAQEIFGYTKAEALDNPIDMLYGKSSDCSHIKKELKQFEKFEGEIINKRKNGSDFYSFISASPLRDSKGNAIGVMGISRDITERKQFEEKLQLQLRRLKALNSTEKALNASLDLRVTLDVMLKEITSQLNIDAASVLLLNKHTQSLEYISNIGFCSDALKYTQLRVGEGYAGRAALDRRIVTVSNLDEDPGDFGNSKLLSEEDFCIYFGVPLIVKGQVRGVLELFHRTPLNPDEDWFEFLETIASQAAIAIDTAALFEDLQRSNTELILAYDTTLEGWSKAIDLRDKVTEGHSQRVTDMTLHIARIMGVSESELAHIRRGALLHDIGKLGVPDRILHKPDKLNEKEWEIMKRHPKYAYDMLCTINFLRSAIDIPYCHHEKWDGTGYPRGLKGEEIPLAVRIFAVVDVWDAITSDRPYNKAWTKEKAREFIISCVGTHFDPKVVEAFLEVEW